MDLHDRRLDRKETSQKVSVESVDLSVKKSHVSGRQTPSEPLTLPRPQNRSN